MIRDIWIEVSDFLFKLRDFSFLDIVALLVWTIFIWPTLTLTIPMWIAILYGIGIVVIYVMVSTFCTYKFTKANRSEYFYEKG